MNTNTHIAVVSNSLSSLASKLDEINANAATAIQELVRLEDYINKHATYNSVSRMNSAASRFDDLRTLLVDIRKAAI